MCHIREGEGRRGGGGEEGGRGEEGGETEEGKGGAQRPHKDSPAPVGLSATGTIEKG